MEKVTMRLLLSLLVFLSAFTFAQPGNKTTTATIAGGKIYRGIEDPNGGCGCANTNPASPCTGTSITQTFSPITFKWTFSCSGGNCQCGRFINGDYWVKHPSGGDVVISAVTPAGNENGLVQDPTSVLSENQQTRTQGFLGNASGYVASLNKMLNLPLSVSSNKTLVKASQLTGDKTYGYPTTCGGYIAQSYSMLTVLGSVPNDGANGRNSFRPAYTAGSKTVHSITDFDFTRLAGRADITVTQSDLDTMSRWWRPYPDVDGDDYGRCFVPQGYYPDNYSAGIALNVINDILKLNGTLTGLSSNDAKYAMVQRGLDIYYSWQSGNKWNCGAGQCLGRKEPMIYMAALTTDSTIRTNVSSSALNGQDFQEDNQIKVTANSGGRPIWGGPPLNSDWTYTYWQKVFDSKCYDGANPTVNCLDTLGNRAVGDPYGYIDGPAQAPGSIYMPVSTGTHVGHAALMLGWQHYCEMANDQETISYADRFYYPSNTTASGQVLNQDACAPPDTREPNTCYPYPQFPNPSGYGCLYYGGRPGATDGNSTWGPLPSNPAQCVTNNSNGNTGQTGRFSWLQGKTLITISTTTPGAISYNVVPGYISTIAKNQYATIRTATPKCNNGIWTP